MHDAPNMFAEAWSAIGRLTAFWATLESSLVQELRTYASGDESDQDEVTYALVNGLRWADMMKAFKRIAAIKGASDEAVAILTDIHTEAGKIKNIRDLVAHHSFHISGEQRDVLIFHLWGKTKESSFHACYTQSEITLCADYAFRLAMRVSLELRSALRGQPVPPDSEPLRSWREKPTLPRLPAEDSHRDSRVYLRPHEPSPG